MRYTMMQVCKETGMTYQALKFYCNEGLVPNVKRDKNNRRVFDERDVAWISSLTRLKIRDLADLQHAVLCHGGRPRQLASGVVIFRIGQQNADVADDAAHDGLIDIIGEVVFIYKYRL